MPLLQINSNVAKEKFTKEYILNFGDVLTKAMNKPIDFCVIHVLADQLMSFGETFEPLAILTLSSIGHLGVEENKTYSKVIMTELEKLGIPPTRVFISFNELQPSEVGYNKTTIADSK